MQRQLRRRLARDLAIGLRRLFRPDRRRRSACRRRPVRGCGCRAAASRAAARRIRCAMRSPPPLPKICSSWPHFEQMCVAMFSTMPSTGTSTFSNIFSALARVEQRDVLRRRHDDRAGHRHALAQRQLDVAGSRRQIDDQVIQIDPVRFVEQLRQRLRDHRTAPDHRRVFLDHEADRHGLDAVRRSSVRCAGRPSNRACPKHPACAECSARRCRHRAGRPWRLRPATRARDSPPSCSCRRRPCPRRPRGYFSRSAAASGPSAPCAHARARSR